MSRSGYIDDWDDNWPLICSRGAVKSAIRGKRGQAMLRELLDALDAMPRKRLIEGELEADGEHCALGALGAKRDLAMFDLDPYDYGRLSECFGVAEALAREVEYVNDECGPRDETPEERWKRVRAWVVAQIREREQEVERHE